MLTDAEWALPAAQTLSATAPVSSSQNEGTVWITAPSMATDDEFIKAGGN